MTSPHDHASPDLTVGVVGLGSMGHRIATRLHNRGMQVVGFDPYVRDIGVPRCRSLRGLAAQTQTILLVLPTTRSLTDVTSELEWHARPRHVVANHSTVSVDDAKQLAQQLSRSHILDAPLSGGTEAAERGDLTIFIGGDQDVVSSARPVFEVYANQLVPCGAQGTGMATKLLHQHLVGSTVVACSEMFALARSFGLEPVDIAATLSRSAADSPVLRMLEARLRSRDAVVHGSCNILLKDLELVLETADRTQTDAPALSAAAGLVAEHVNRGYGDEDISTLADPSRPDATQRRLRQRS